MDYSAVNDPDHPAGASPWGASSPHSSPQHTTTTASSSGLGTDHRTSFGSGSGDGAASDPSLSPPAFRYGAAGGAGPPRSEGSSMGAGAAGRGGLFGADDDDEPGMNRPGTASTASESGGGSLENSAALLPPAAIAGGYVPQGQGQIPQQQQQQRGQYQQQQAQQQYPTGQQQQQHPAPGQQDQIRPQQQQFKLQAKITGLERTGRKDPILRFDVHTNLPRFRTTQYRDVRRLHSEFVKLAEHLISANPECLVPAVPPPLTSAGAGTDEDEARVKGLMQRWFNYVCASEVLARDDEVVLFVESDFGYSPVVKMKQPATGVRRKILKQFAPPPDDTPELQQARPIVKLFYLGSMDAGHKVDKLVKSRRGLGLAESDFGVKLGGMNVQEPHQGLANAYRKLGKIIQTVGDCHAAQATAEATTIGDPFQYHSSDAFIVKETLTNRQILMRELLQAQDSTRARLAAADRLKASTNVRRERVDEAIAALDEARVTESSLFEKNARVTHNLVFERRRWFFRTAADLRMAVREFVIREIEAERRTLALLETVRPDIRTIDASGGLSRLGREANPPHGHHQHQQGAAAVAAVRRTSLAASQGPKGDAWSGVPRRSDLARSASSVAGVSSVSTAAASAEDGTASTVDGSVAGAPGDGDDSSVTRLPGSIPEEDDEDRVDARNAASRLATSTF